MAAQKEAIAALREIIEARLNASDKAVGLVHDGHTELKGAVREQINQLRELHDEKFLSIKSDIDTKFSGIQTQFVAFERLREQLSVADKVAVAAALQAQKESAGAMQLANAEALEKMAAGFTKQIDGTVLALQALAKNMDEKIQDLKGRLDRGDGKFTGAGQTWGVVVAIAGIGIAALTLLVKLPGSTLPDTNSVAISRLEYMFEQHLKQEAGRPLTMPAPLTR